MAPTFSQAPGSQAGDHVILLSLCSPVTNIPSQIHLLFDCHHPNAGPLTSHLCQFRALCLLPSSLVPNQPSPLLTLTLLGAPHCQVNQAKLFHCRIQDALQNHSSQVSGPISTLFQPNYFTSYSLPDLFLNLLCCYYCLEYLFFSC